MRSRVEEVLAVVEHEEQALLPEEVDDALFERRSLSWAHAERGREQLDQRVVVTRGSELAQPRTVGVVGKYLGCHLRREARLTDATDPDDRDQSRPLERLGDPDQVLVASDEGRELHGKVSPESVDRPKWREVAVEPGRVDLEHPLGAREIAQAVLTEIG
jgi:hypothetical protein